MDDDQCYSCYPLKFDDYHHCFYDFNDQDKLLTRTFSEYDGSDVPRNRIVTDIFVSDESVRSISKHAFVYMTNLLDFRSRNNLSTIGVGAFEGCDSLVNVSIPGLLTIEGAAFYSCHNLCNIQFGDSLQTIGPYAFYEAMECQGTCLNLPELLSIGEQAFQSSGLREIVCSNKLQRIEKEVFDGCRFLRRMVIPLKIDLFERNGSAFRIGYLRWGLVIELVHEVQDVVNSLFMESWKERMRSKMSLNIPSGQHKTDLTIMIHEWLVKTDSDLKQYEAQHYDLLKEIATLLELAIWKFMIENYEEEKYFLHMRETFLTWLDIKPKKKAKIDRFARSELRFVPGYDVIIRNVMSYL